MSILRAHPSEYTYTPAEPAELRFEQGAYGERFRSAAAPQQSANVSTGIEQVCRPGILLEIIFYSKIHLVTPEEFIEKAAKYQNILRDETLLLYNDVKDNKKIYQEWADPSGFMASAVASTVTFFQTIGRAPKPDPAEFEKLLDRICIAGDKVQQTANALTYENIHDLGIQLALIREDSRRLYKKIDLFRNRAIDTAETMTKGLETVEGASFQVLALVPTITGMDPFREAAYRISLVLLRAGGRSAGAALAETSILRELCGVLKADVPPMLVEVISSVLRGVIPKGAGKEFLIFIVKQQVEFLCDVSILIHDRGGKVTQDDIKQLGMNRLTSCLSELLSKALGGKPTDTRIQKLARSFAENTLNTLWRDILTARDTAKTQGKEFWEVFLSELPWTLVKVIQGTFVGCLQRNAQGFHDETQKQDPLDVLRAQKASAIFSGKPTPPAAPAKANRPLLAPMPVSEYRQWFAEAHLHPDIAGPLRRYAHDADQYVGVRIPSAAMAQHSAEYSKRPKPLWIKAKSAHLGANEGLVVKPSQNPPTHRDYAAAKKTWDKNLDTLVKNGGMISDDGIVFHPDQLRDAGPQFKQAADILEQAAKAGHYDLTLHPMDPAVLNAIRQARPGFYPDLDLAEVFDASTGDRIPMGAGNESDPAELAYLQRNRSNLDQTINVNDDVRNIPPEARAPDGNPRISTNNVTPHVQSLFQHGADHEYYAGGEGGPVAVIGPNGFLKTFNNREEFEAGMRLILGQKYQDPGQRQARGLLLTKATKLDPTNGVKATGSGQRIDTAKFQRMEWYYERSKRDAEGLGEPIPPHDIWMSLFHRGLVAEQRFPPAPDTYIAIDQDRRNIIIAAATNGTFANGLARLARTAIKLAPDAQIWFELYSAFKPVTSDHILNRIGGQDPGVSSSVDDVSDLVTAFVKKPGQKLYAFCVDGFIPAFCPQPSPGDRNREIHDEIVRSFGYTKVEGQKLMAVWEDQKSRKFTYEQVKILGQPVSLFTSGLAACPANVQPHEISNYVEPLLVG